MKEFNIPYDVSIKLTGNVGKFISQLKYASAIGGLIYAMHCTRLDMTFAVGKLSRYIHNPSREHWKAICRDFGYLKSTKTLGLFYTKFPHVLEGYSDTSWKSSVKDKDSTYGWIFILASGAIFWASMT